MLGGSSLRSLWGALQFAHELRFFRVDAGLRGFQAGLEGGPRGLEGLGIRKFNEVFRISLPILEAKLVPPTEMKAAFLGLSLTGCARALVPNIRPAFARAVATQAAAVAAPPVADVFRRRLTDTCDDGREMWPRGLSTDVEDDVRGSLDAQNIYREEERRRRVCSIRFSTTASRLAAPK